MVTKELNSKVVVATVESWMGTELVRFEGRDSSGNAIDWREETANDYARNGNGRKFLLNQKSMRNVIMGS